MSIQNHWPEFEHEYARKYGKTSKSNLVKKYKIYEQYHPEIHVQPEPFENWNNYIKLHKRKCGSVSRDNLKYDYNNYKRTGKIVCSPRRQTRSPHRKMSPRIIKSSLLKSQKIPEQKYDLSIFLK